MKKVNYPGMAYKNAVGKYLKGRKGELPGMAYKTALAKILKRKK